jgi:MerR family transcriptional regulator, heat shock protein HspR
VMRSEVVMSKVSVQSYPTQVERTLRKLTRVISMPRLEECKGHRNSMAAEQELYFISVAAEMLSMHPQTLRKYERLGLIQPTRTVGSMRLYSREELERLRLIKRLVEDLGINLAGVQRLLDIAAVMQRIRPLMDESALSTGTGRRQLLTEMRRLNDVIGL